MEEPKIRRKPYKPKLRYSDEIDYKTWGKVAGRCYKSEKTMLERVEKVYRSKIVRRRRVIRERTLLYQVKLENDTTVEIAYLEVGIKGYYTRYSKVKKMRWRDKKIGRRLDYEEELE